MGIARLALFGSLASLIACSTTESPHVWTHSEAAFAGNRVPASLEVRLRTSDRLPAFYTKALGLGEMDWSAIEVPKDLRLESGKPVPEFYNSHLLRAKDAKGQVRYFRPVDTTTGCTSGCTPVVFHLVLGEDGSVLRILEESETPLRKVNHQVFTAFDRARALETARKLPEALRFVKGTTQLTDGLGTFPPQTWSAFQPSLVPGGAYTSYRIFEAALKSFEALNPGRDEFERFRQLKEVFDQELKGIHDGKSARAFVGRRSADLDDIRLPSEFRGLVLSQLTNIVGEIFESEFTPRDFELVRSVYQSRAGMQYGRRAFCDFLVSTLEAGEKAKAELVLGIFRERNTFPECSAKVDEVFRFLATAGAEREGAARELAEKLDFGARPEFLLKAPQLFQRYARAATLAGKADIGQRLGVELLVRYPKLHWSGARPDEGTKGAALRTELEAAYRAELKRGFLETPRPIEGILAHRGLQYEEPHSVGLPLKGQGARLYVFFASGCGHCRSTLGGWMKANFSDAFWSRVQLVEAFDEWSKTPLADFCRKTGFTGGRRAELCERAPRLKESDPDHAAFLEKLEIRGIPSLVIANGRGEILRTKVDLPEHPAADLERDVAWLLAGFQ